MSLDLNEFHGMFFEESFEALDDMESGLLNLDVTADALDIDAINTIFRGAHSVKGGSGMFGFTEVTGFTHVLETLLDQVRDGLLGLDQAKVDVMLQAVDCLREMLQSTQEGASVGSPHVTQTQKAMEAILEGDDAAAAATPASAPTNADAAPSVTEEPGSPTGNSDQSAPVSPQWKIQFKPHPDILDTANDPLYIMRELGLLGRLTVIPQVSEVPPLIELEAEKIFVNWELLLETDVGREEIAAVFEWVEGECELSIERLDSAQDTTPSESVAAPAPQDAAAAAKPAVAQESTPAKPAPAAKRAESAAKGSSDSGSIRVGIEKVDSVINLVGELVITQSMLSRFSEDEEFQDLDALRQGLVQLDRNTRELQQTVMQIRMLPISFSFNRFPRLVRDISGKLNKKIELVIEGDQTELDKTVLEKIGDPLLHLVRNSLDHGIEMPEDRIAAGKNEAGILKLNAYHSGGNIVIEVIDDGQGLPRAKILQKAKDRGLVGPDEELTPDQIHNLVFHPGFSTADNVSEISGRGVGMDVVKRNIQDLGGNVEVESEEGQGCTFRIRLPLTLAILDGQLLRVGKEIYVISLVSIVESLQVTLDNVNAIAGQAELFRLRDEYIPIVRINELFEVESECTRLEDGLLVVVEADGMRVGLFVDDLLGQQQVVIKSLETNFRQVPGLSGATILGDGTVALIIDAPSLVNKCLADGFGNAAVRSLSAA